LIPTATKKARSAGFFCARNLSAKAGGFQYPVRIGNYLPPAMPVVLRQAQHERRICMLLPFTPSASTGERHSGRMDVLYHEPENGSLSRTENGSNRRFTVSM